MKNPMLQQLGPFPRILFSVLLIITCFFLLFLTGLLIAMPLFGVSLTETMTLLADFSDPRAIALLKFFQIVQEFGLFIIPPLLAALFFAVKPFRFLRADDFSRWQVWQAILSSGAHGR